MMEVQFMRATLNIPDDLIKEVQRITGAKSKTEAIVISMEEMVRQKKVKNLMALRGKIKIDDLTGETERLEQEETSENDKSWRNR